MSKQDARPPASASHLQGLLSPRLFKALCDPTRLKLLQRVCEEAAPCTVGDVARCCPVHLSVVSRHLALLRDAGVLQAVRRGKEVYYSLSGPALVRTLRGLADAIESCCEATGCCGVEPRKRKRSRRKEKRS